ncbi:MULTISPECIES: hypothetical protein [Leuconostoc]|uniref:Uncharacterized protein n=1 Tax=Leuconostoc pseudomesenteroides TaxID=33968 RepID=A0A1X0VCA7_LEUPS|nr:MULTISPECIES: hypothetical protein [Leuconostoc]KDA47857.1 hypothetical protein L964_504 [Leuconostoc pseudomesenteroides 1159]KDA50199.1 hypothetical protein L965_298 [Leuconostoc pseudomesenteroides PS12]CCJ65646.1 hypothetical protein Q5C_03845 [Leuconostoc pseudomesenteroides 4882]MCT4420154.1 hypothetical protein [Leuconostoc falkenbergense]MDG9744965.1 hypothetical protein [Leuconostoc falkenbergense]
MIDNLYTSLPIASIKDKVTIFFVDASMTDKLESLYLQFISELPRVNPTYATFLKKKWHQIALVFLVETILVTTLIMFWLVGGQLNISLIMISMFLYGVVICLALFRLRQYRLLKKGTFLFADYHQNGFQWPKDNVPINQPWQVLYVLEFDNHFVIHLVLEVSYVLMLKRRAIYIPKSKLSLADVRALQESSIRVTRN